jgi:acyl dehydratase
MGKYFEEFEIGDEFKSPGRTITETDVVQFAGLSGDYNPLHTDVEYCKDTLFGQRVAHGLLGLSIMSGLVTRIGVFDGTIIAFLNVDWSFTKPIFIGDTVHFSMKIISKTETSKRDRGIIGREIQLINQRNEVVQQGTTTLMMKKKPIEQGANI